MLAPERHRAILRLLSERGRLTLDEVRAQLAISTATIRRDAEHLAGAGLVLRTHGGLLPPDFALAEQGYLHKSARASGVKARLGRAVAELLPESGTLFIDAGTTCLEVGRAVLDRPQLRIFTNSIPLLALAPEARASLNSIGGEARKVSLALTGALAQGWLQQLRFDAAVVGASGLEPAHGAFTTELAEAGTKTEALRRSRLRILVADDQKWQRPAAVRFSAWEAFHHFVTNKNLTRSERSTLDRFGVKTKFVASK